jgi:hypothetical protein
VIGRDGERVTEDGGREWMISQTSKSVPLLIPSPAKISNASNNTSAFIPDRFITHVLTKIPDEDQAALVTNHDRFILGSKFTDPIFCTNLGALIARIWRLCLPTGFYDNFPISNPFQKLAPQIIAFNNAFQRFRAFCILESVLEMNCCFDPGHFDRDIAEILAENCDESNAFAKIAHEVAQLSMSFSQIPGPRISRSARSLKCSETSASRPFGVRLRPRQTRRTIQTPNVQSRWFVSRFDRLRPLPIRIVISSKNARE